MDIIEKRKQNLISITYFSVFVVIFVLFMKYAFWIFAPFIAALIIALVLQKPINFLSQKTKIKKKLLAVVLVLLLVAVLIGLIVLIGYLAGNEFYGFAKFLYSKMSALPELIISARDRLEALINRLPGGVAGSLSSAISDIAGKAMNLVKESETATEETVSNASSHSFDFSVLASPLGGIWSTAKQIPSVLMAVLISIIACFFITSDYEGFTAIFKKSLSPEHVRTVAKAKRIIIGVLGKWVKSYATIMLITFFEILIGLYILKWAGLYTGGYIFVISLCIAIMDILPVFGTGTIVIPWAVISLFTHKIGLGIGLIIIYALITVIRQVLEPKLVSANVGMHPVITLLSMYVGIQVFGVLGIFILPISVIIVKTLNEQRVIHLWGNYEPEPVEELPAAPGGGEEPAAAEEPAQEVKKDS